MVKIGMKKPSFEKNAAENQTLAKLLNLN